MTDPAVRTQRYRSGTTVVETAIVLPVFIVFVFGLIAYGHAQMCANMLKGAVRTGARMGATEGVSTPQVTARVKQVASGAIRPTAVTVEVKDASAYDKGGAFPSSASAMSAMPNLELSSAQSRQLFMVRASVNYNDVAILPMPWLKGVRLSSQTFMRHE